MSYISNSTDNEWIIAKILHKCIYNKIQLQEVPNNIDYNKI